MSADSELARLAESQGILLSYRDMQGGERTATPDTLRALLAAMGIAAESSSLVRESLAYFRAQRRERLLPEEVIVESRLARQLTFGSAAGWTLRCEESESVVAGGAATDTIGLPALAPGVYLLDAGSARQRETVRIISAPDRAPGVQETTGRQRIWGMNLALYGLRSSRNAGLGDYSDLAETSLAIGKLGASFIGINPVHAMGHSESAFSPYSPSHRGFLNTAHIALDAIPGLESSANAQRIVSQADADLTRLRSARHVDYERHKPTHMQLLSALHDTFQSDAPASTHAAVAAFRQERGGELAKFAWFEAMADRHGSDWRSWPASFQSIPQTSREDFHVWLQWVADCQLGNAQHVACDSGMELGLFLDLAVGPRRNGAESWCERVAIAQHVSVGAPPDHVNPEGQNWNLAALSPRGLAVQNYRPVRRLLASTMRHAGVVRIDHIIGLGRSFWVPDDGSPGGYVRQPLKALLTILKIEAERAGTVVVGEDLGLVPSGLRRAMSDNGIYGYSVLQYERDGNGTLKRADSASKQVLSCFSTHDTPTVRGFETGRDIHWWKTLGWVDERESARAQTQRRKDVDGLMEQRLEADFTTTVHKSLARSPSTMVTAQLDDILEHEDAQNLPGTTDAHPNWRRKYDVSVEALSGDSRFQAIGGLMNRGRGQSRRPHPGEIT